MNKGSAKKFGIGILGVLIVLAVAWFALAPRIFEQNTNLVDGKPLPDIRPEAQKLHDSLMIVDLHADTLLWKRKINDSVDYGHVDLGRLEEGNVGLQIFSSVTKTPRGQNYDRNSAETDNITPLVITQLQPIRTWFSLLERQLYHSAKLHDAVSASEGAMVHIKEPLDLKTLSETRIKKSGPKKSGAQTSGTKTGTKDRAAAVGVLFSAEGLQSLEGDIQNLKLLHGAGLRMAGLVHFFDNRLAGSMHGEEKGGLTRFGKEVMGQMEAQGIIVDIAHASHAAVADILKIARRPVVSSHGGVQAVCNINRNLTDDEIRGVAATGGVIGLGYWEGAMCNTDPKTFARAARHVRDLVGIEYIALGGDFDGAVTTRFDAGGLVHITQALIDAGFSESEIAAVMGGNAVRVIKQGIAPAFISRQ